MDPLTEIASGFTVKDYLSLRDRLIPTDPTTGDWDKIIAAFERRMVDRFWGPIRRLEIDDSSESTVRPGFAIVALCCMIIETLNSFENGRPLPSYGPSKHKFLDFLQNRLGLENADATSLYRAVRNKLLHDGETRENWKILRGKGGHSWQTRVGTRIKLDSLPHRVRARIPIVLCEIANTA